MKRYIIAIFLLLSVGQVALAQDEPASLRDRLAKRQQAEDKKKEPTIQRLSVREEKKNEMLTRDFANASWIREVYRKLDVSKGRNAALNNPKTPLKGRMNLITMIFKLMAQGDLTAYRFQLDDDFSELNKVDFGEELERMEIPYEKMDNQYTFNEMDFPMDEVYGYYIKEVWYFDQSNSVLGRDVVAICPVLDRANYDLMGTSFENDDAFKTRVPLFWIPYENLRPFAARMPIMTSDYNNVINKTIDDYFRLGLYEGEIYKTTNMENKILQEKYKTEEEMKAAQKKIELELREFEKSLWSVNDSISDDVKAKQDKRIKKVKAKKAKATKSKTKSQSSSSGVKYSARDRRK